MIEYSKEYYSMEGETVGEDNYGQMGAFIKDTGKMIVKMDLDDSYIKTEIVIKDNG